jgi:hypothetical protein
MSDKELTRRDFIKGTAAVIGGLIGAVDRAAISCLSTLTSSASRRRYRFD